MIRASFGIVLSVLSERIDLPYSLILIEIEPGLIIEGMAGKGRLSQMEVLGLIPTSGPEYFHIDTTQTAIIPTEEQMLGPVEHVLDELHSTSLMRGVAGTM